MRESRETESKGSESSAHSRGMVTWKCGVPDVMEANFWPNALEQLKWDPLNLNTLCWRMQFLTFVTFERLDREAHGDLKLDDALYQTFTQDLDGTRICAFGASTQIRL